MATMGEKSNMATVGMIRRMGTSHIHKALKRLVNNLDEDENDPQDDNFKILWIGRFQQEMRRRAALN